MNNLILHLSLIENIGPTTINKILLKNDDEINLYDLSISEIQRIFGLTFEKANLIFSGLKQKDFLEKELNLIEKNKIKNLTILDSAYPKLLKEIEVPPAVLYYQGNLNLEDSLSIVGSRAATGYGQRVIKNLIPELVANNWSIISGGALGIDSFAHQETLNSNGKTVAILGSGFLNLYPIQNQKLFEKIIENDGAIVSPFNLNMEPMPGNFPARNRIVSGLSRGTLVIQAAKKSGALITAKYALDQGREVFAVPGLMDDPLSEGCHCLIKNGAKLVTSVEDILQEFDITYNQTTIYSDTFRKENHPILDACFQPSSLEDIHNITGIEIGSLQIQLFDLQIEGKIKQNFAGLWERSLI